jgi:hypothetical protein
MHFLGATRHDGFLIDGCEDCNHAFSIYFVRIQARVVPLRERRERGREGGREGEIVGRREEGREGKKEDVPVLATPPAAFLASGAR